MFIAVVLICVTSGSSISTILLSMLTTTDSMDSTVALH